MTRAVARCRHTGRVGMTLVELLVVLLILGVAAAVAAPAVRAPAALTDPEGETVRRLRMRAQLERAPVTDTVTLGTGLAFLTVWPNGLVLADSASVARGGAPRRADVH